MDELSSLSRHSFFEPTLFGLVGLLILFLCSRLVYRVSYRYAGDSAVAMAIIMTAITFVTFFIAFFLLIPMDYYLNDIALCIIMSLVSPAIVMMAVLGIAMYKREYDDKKTTVKIIEELGTSPKPTV